MSAVENPEGFNVQYPTLNIQYPSGEKGTADFRAEAQRRGGAWAILWGGSICVHLRYLRLKIRNFHGMENILCETIRMKVQCLNPVILSKIENR
jgi:hypothetical protein